jgi:hypothetical protein
MPGSVSVGFGLSFFGLRSSSLRRAHGLIELYVVVWFEARFRGTHHVLHSRSVLWPVRRKDTLQEQRMSLVRAISFDDQPVILDTHEDAAGRTVDGDRLRHGRRRRTGPHCARFASFGFCSGCDARLHPPVRVAAATMIGAGTFVSFDTRDPSCPAQSCRTLLAIPTSDVPPRFTQWKNAIYGGAYLPSFAASSRNCLPP